MRHLVRLSTCWEYRSACLPSSSHVTRKFELLLLTYIYRFLHGMAPRDESNTRCPENCANRHDTYRGGTGPDRVAVVALVAGFFIRGRMAGQQTLGVRCYESN